MTPTTGRCRTKGCPSVSAACAFHTIRYPRGFGGTDRLIRQRPGETERGGGFMSPKPTASVAATA